MNVLSATGNLGQDCRINQVSGTSVCNFSVAMKAGFGDKAQTLWLDCALWGKAAEGALPDYLKKGQQVAVSGELSTREHEGKTYLQLRCNSVDLIGKRDDSGGGNSGGDPRQQSQQAAPAQSQQPAQNQQQSAPQQGGMMDDDQGIPF